MGEQKIYLKELANNAVYDSKGRVIPFHQVGDDIGGIKLDTERDAEMISEIEKHIKAKTGGIYAATEGQYADVSKKPVFVQSQPQSEPLRVFSNNKVQPTAPQAVDAAAANQPPAIPPKPIPGIHPLAAASLLTPAAPAKPSPAESGQEPPAAPVKSTPRIARPKKITAAPVGA
jgi:hypothetical protein